MQKRLDILLQDELEHPALFFLNQRLQNQISCPIISIVHHLRSEEWRPSWQNHLYRIIERRYLLSVDGFIFNSETTQASVNQLCGKEGNGVVAYPCGNPKLVPNITEAEIAERAIESGPLRIIFVGNVIRRKGLHILLSSLLHLPSESCFLTVIGSLSADRVYVRTIQKQIQANRLESRVTLMDAVPDGELTAHLKSAQLLAVPSFYEGFGIVYLEGMGFGLPAIGSSAGGAREVITHDESGFLTPAGDVSALVEYIGTLSRNRELLSVMARKAYQRYMVHPNWSQTFQNVAAFLRSFLPRTRLA